VEHLEDLADAGPGRGRRLEQGGDGKFVKRDLRAKLLAG
jgi:hypothetical protein